MKHSAKKISALKRIQKLDQKATKIHHKVFEQTDCLSCANCCKSIPPIITKTDAKRIANYLKIGVGEFLTKHVIFDQDDDMVFNQSPCCFLNQDNTCQIYEVRPKACKNYPHTDRNFSKHIELHLVNIDYCPAVGEIFEHILKDLS